MAEKFSVVFVLNFMEDGVLKVQLLEQIEKFWKYRKLGIIKVAKFGCPLLFVNIRERRSSGYNHEHIL
jgi:hypothetical protein